MFFFLNTYYMWVESLYILCPIMIWVGLMGGAAYVNVMHSLLKLDTLRQSEKEGALVLSLIFNDSGVLLASIFTLIIDNTLFKTK